MNNHDTIRHSKIQLKWSSIKINSNEKEAVFKNPASNNVLSTNYDKLYAIVLLTVKITLDKCLKINT